MAAKRMNVLVYSGTGSTVESVRHCLYTLRRLLSPKYAIVPITGDTLLKEPWTDSCSLLVFPGGADQGYCKTLNGDGNRKIKKYVSDGGSYLGLCAGGYYGSSQCEFEVGDKKMEVIGTRELSFFPDTSRGSALSGFVYNSEAGARAVRLGVVKHSFGTTGHGNLTDFRSYFNGGSVFVNAPRYKDKGVEILATYEDKLDVDPGEGLAAVVFCKCGEGNVILTGPHPEFAGANLRKDATGMNPSVVDEITEDDDKRQAFFKACLLKLGMEVNQEEQQVPSLSRIHLSALDLRQVSRIVESWEAIITPVDGEDYIKGEQDVFHLDKSPSAWSMKAVAKAVTEVFADNTDAKQSQNRSRDKMVNYDELIKTICVREELPSAKETPYFNHAAFFANLSAYRGNDPHNDGKAGAFGNVLLYGEVVTSTSSLLERNVSLSSNLPTGTTFTATTQVAARGRGSNPWISPPGALMASIVIKHPLTLNTQAPIVFIQYLAAMAVAEGVQTYDLDAEARAANRRSAYRPMPVKLKWPNDIYALDPSSSTASPDASLGKETDDAAYTKIGGVLVNTSYASGEYTLVVGIGLNVSNAAPTTSLNAVLDAMNARREANLPHYTLERLLARILTLFEQMYAKFCAKGFAGELEELYYRRWLHSEQIVTLDTEEAAIPDGHSQGRTAGREVKAKAKIIGITTDWGFLKAEELVDVGVGEYKGTGKMFVLQSDMNSFDFFQGLVRRKM